MLPAALNKNSGLADYRCLNRYMKTVGPSFIAGIGGSAGGLSYYKELLDALPANLNIAFVIVSHMLPTASSQLAKILSRHTKMPVVVAAAAMPIRPNHVYVCPPDSDLLVERHAFKVVSPRTKRNVAIDLFFTSVAAAMGARAIGIILSGYDGDGSEGCRQIKANGGITFAQDKSAEVNGMSLSAQATGCVDFVLPPDRIADALQKMAHWFGE